MDAELKTGNKVMLKSNGRVMTFHVYEQVLSDKMAVCSWFYDGEQIKERFFMDAIERVVE